MSNRIPTAVKRFFSWENLARDLWSLAVALVVPSGIRFFTHLDLWQAVCLGASGFLFSLGAFISWDKRGKAYLQKRREQQSPTQASPPFTGHRFSAESERAGEGVSLKLRCTSSPNTRPAYWGCKVIDPENPNWTARVRSGVGSKRQDESPSSEIIVHFPEDFAHVPDSLPSGWYRVEWVHPKVDGRTGGIIPEEEWTFAKCDFFFSSALNSSKGSPRD